MGECVPGWCCLDHSRVTDTIFTFHQKSAKCIEPSPPPLEGTSILTHKRWQSNSISTITRRVLFHLSWNTANQLHTHTHTFVAVHCCASVLCSVTSKIWQLPDEATQRAEMETLSSTHLCKRKLHCSSFQHVRLRECEKQKSASNSAQFDGVAPKKWAQTPWCHVN